jgi:hypothetical protein
MVSTPAMAEFDKHPGQNEPQTSLDERYPLVEQGAEPPGRSVPGPDGVGHRWEGALGWRTRHGNAVVSWSLGKPQAASGALLPDGRRGDVAHVLDHGYRRQGSGSRRWVYGTIDIRPGDVIFADDLRQPAYSPPPPGDHADLERTLAGDPAFLSALQDDWFAHATYVVFHNREFVREADLATWSCGDRQAARLVADLRGAGESYEDYFLNYDFPESWPDDQPRSEVWLRQLIEASEKLLVAQWQIELPLGARFDGEIIETPEQAARIRQKLREVYEHARPEIEGRLSLLRAQLAELHDRPEPAVMNTLRAHLARIGWRTVNADDERRMGAEAMSAGLDLLENIKQREALQPEKPGARWREPSPASKAGLGLIASGTPDSLTPDERAVRTGLDLRIDALAASGRLSEQEYEAMKGRAQAISRRIGGYTKQ